MNKIDDPKFARVVTLFRLAFLARQRSEFYRCEARMRYGVAGNVSGGLCDHWPESEKTRIRRCNKAQYRLEDAAFNARPARVQMDTIRQLRLDTITREIRRQHGNA